MIPGTLATDGGPHSPEDWAMMTADMHVSALQVKPDSPRRATLELAKERAKMAICGLMVRYHALGQLSG